MGRLLAILLVALGIAAWAIAVWSSEGEPEALPVATKDAEDRSPREAVATANAGPLRSAVEAPVAGARLRVRVIDAASKAPVAGAEVLALDVDAFDRRLIEAGLAIEMPEARAMRRAHAVTSRTADDGIAELIVHATRLSVEARRGADWGTVFLTAVPADVVEIALARDDELRVRVVDLSGLPRAGVPVALRLRRTGATSSERVTTTEGEDGIARFLHVQRRFALGEGWHVGLAFPVAPETVVPVSASDPPRDVIELRLPPTGSLEIAVRDEAGVPLGPERVDLALDAFVAPSSILPIAEARHWSRPRLSSDGIARVPWLGLGLHLRATIREQEAPRDPETFAIIGPIAAGETKRCELVLGRGARPWPVVIGRFVHRDGTPWPAGEVEAWPWFMPGAGAAHEQESIRIAADGRFRFAVRAPRVPGGRRGFRLLARGDASRGLVIGALDLSRDFDAPVTDLGDVLLDHGAAIASGRVLDLQRRPIARAQVVALAPWAGSSGEEMRNVEVAGTWRTGDDGAFALFAVQDADCPATGLHVTAHANGFLTPKPQPIALGANGVVIGRSIRLLAGQAANDFAVTARDGRQVQGAQIAADGSFQITALAAGSYRVMAKLKSDVPADARDSFFEVEGIVVREGEASEDRRLYDITIGTITTRLALRVLDESSAPIENARVRVAGEGRGGEARSGADGVAVLRGRALPVDLEIEAFGFRGTTVTGVDRDQDVVLRRGLPVRITCSVPAHGSEPRYDLGLQFHVLGQDGRAGPMLWPESTPLELRYFDARGELRLHLPGPGRYAMSVFVFVAGKDNVGRGGVLSLDPPRSIDVIEPAHTQEFRIEIPQDRLDEMLGRLRGPTKESP
ncbi:MAG: carboxypeptidase regulatory-like domain-containing protein [Planctomycetes bacterium]|nr:carboxypeptidase regulatory-like domain-containing protein [Planctomycetota bacterium]